MKLLVKNVLPIDGDGKTLCDIAITDGIIEALGGAPEGFTPDETVEGGGRLCMPALVNAHTHMYMSVLRGCFKQPK